MSFTFIDFFLMIGVLIIMMLLYRYSDRWVKKLRPETVKTVNWVGFILGVVGGVLWYAFSNNIFMLMALAGIVLYFLFYDYDKMEEEQKHR